MKKPIVIGVIFVVAVFALLVYNSMQLSEVRVEVCITFNGESVCRKARGPDRETAQRNATDNACSYLTSGVTGTISCMQTRPDSVTWLE